MENIENKIRKYCQRIIYDYIHGSSDLQGTSIENGLSSSVKKPSDIDIDAWLVKMNAIKKPLELSQEIIELIKKEDNFLTKEEIINKLNSKFTSPSIMEGVYKIILENKAFVAYFPVNLYGLTEWFQPGTFVLEPEYAVKMLNKQKELY